MTRTKDELVKDVLRYEARKATGEPYDLFEIHKYPDGTKRIVEPITEEPPVHAEDRNSRTLTATDGLRPPLATRKTLSGREPRSSGCPARREAATAQLTRLVKRFGSALMLRSE